MVDRYYRKIEDVENDIENAIQISSILLKLEGYDKKLGDLSKIGDNENNISSNLTRIGDNENNISSKLSKIGDNENNISSNLSKIGDNENNISSNLGKIGDNENNISSNAEKIDNIKEFLISPGNFEKTFNIEKPILRFNRNSHFYIIFEKEITHNFTKNSLLFIDNNIHYKYNNLSNDHHRLQHEYNIYDDEYNPIYKYLFNKDAYYDEKKNPVLLTIDDFCIYFKKIYKKIRIILLLHRHNRHGLGNINLEIDDDSNNYININNIDKNNEDIDKNKKGISSISGKIDENKSDISSNSGQIDENKSDISSNSGQIDENKSNISSKMSEINYLKNNKST